MEKLLLAIYKYSGKHKTAFGLLFLAIFLLLAFFASRLRLEEDIARIIPRDDRTEKLTRIFQESRFADKLIISINAGSGVANPDSLLACGDDLVAAIEKKLPEDLLRLEYRRSDSLIPGLVQLVGDKLPVYLRDSDYGRIRDLFQPDSLRLQLEQDIHNLSTPAGAIMKNMIARDPLGLSLLPLRALSQYQYDDNFLVYDHALFTRDGRHLLIFLTPSFPAQNTARSARLVEDLNDLIAGLAGKKYPDLSVDYFGANAVAAGNAVQLRKDTAYTLGIILVFLVAFIGWYFRRLSAPLLILVPVVFGAVFALACIYFIRGSISVIALGSGSLILGVAISYSLHVYNHYLHTKNMETVVRDLAWPLTIGSFTTIGGFLCLEWVKSEMLKDLGLFAAFSLIGASISALIILPRLLASGKAGSSRGDSGFAWMEKISAAHPEKNKWLVLAIFALTLFFAFHAGRVGFASDMNSMNYMSPGLREAEARLNRITESSLKSVYLVTEGANLQDALAGMEKISGRIDSLRAAGILSRSSSPTALLVSDSLQQKRIAAWNAFWTPEKKQAIMNLLNEEGKKLHIKPGAFEPFRQFLEQSFQPLSGQETEDLKRGLLADFITEKPGSATVTSLLRVSADKKSAIYRAFENQPGITVLDKQYLTEKFVGIVNADFTRIALLTSILVFTVLLLTYGRIELTLVSFIPMLMAWVWILGIMALAGIPFNIINIILSALIFGLGDDYSLFIMDGLLQEYRTGKKNLSSFKSSIVLSAITTLAGLGALIFARHPAMRSIAVISIIGMLCVVLMAQTLIPFFFSLLISNRVRKDRFPWTFFSFSKSIFAFFYFVLGSLIVTICGLFLIKLNFFNREEGKLVYHRILSAYARSVIYIMNNVKKKIINPLGEDFSHPCVVVCNHQSFLDILLTAMLNPKLILLTNRWVWQSPVFGLVVRMADYYPVWQGIENNIDLLQERVARGYSIVVFPEGTRSPDGRMKRFHKGAFFLAEKLRLDILPILIHGSGYTMSKGDFLLKDGQLTLEFLPRIGPEDTRYGEGYSARAKGIGRYFRNAYENLRLREENPRFFREQMIYNYIYKGPVLEWYTRIKTRLEKNYEPFHDLLPRSGRILDLGCGYGMMSYMLKFAGPERLVTGVDYDEEKISLANHCFSKTAGIGFIAADITAWTIEPAGGIILADVLHYLDPGKQEALIRKCIDHLMPGGLLIIREGDRELKRNHRRTRLSEFFSTRLIGFNKTEARGLSFLAGSVIREIAREKNLDCRSIPDSAVTSNMLFVLKKEGNKE